ncbi:PREDICTED: galactoside 2-alpha-L-fucosyltransferase-like [Tarenaya hassleriana]|uniref:galactoside 2-alpha-L-fucosyltransferase-like n=1 Tax=Tarenaya hassleriana TaxID=28532 RepID=UPI00053C1834|nr:PREDICTED: galactoside 2-alpha-L-fucosyltransferase-like [Tarenaya hassleriana]
MNLWRSFAPCLIIFSTILLAFSMIFHGQPCDLHRFIGTTTARIHTGRVSPNATASGSKDSDTLLGGLLAAGFDQGSCHSRYQSMLYRKPSPYKPSQYLVSKLRNYEMLHKKCGPATEAYRRTLEQLNQEHVNVSGYGECKYAVWVPLAGLGNRILSLASVFLYALLTDRVLLVERGPDLDDLFCEPFPGTSWLLPLDFPMRGEFHMLNQQSSNSYGNMPKNQTSNSSTEGVPSQMYLHLVHDYGDRDKMFFCEGDEALIQRIPWLVIKSDQYFIPSLWMIPGFQHELTKLFPQKDTVFHHLGRYLFHPTDQVWGLVTRFYQTHLSTAEERVGIQVRTFDGKGPFQYVMDQIVACIRREELLPEVDTEGSMANIPKRKAVLVTSMSPWYAKNLKGMFQEHQRREGDDVIGVYQPSHEEYQQTGKKLHDQKALAEMYLLSLSDKLVTSGWSTFGYVAHGLAGLKPWILYKPKNKTTPDPPCGRAMSMEPCFHFPPFYDCKSKRGADTGKIIPYVRHCEDWSIGLRLFDGIGES